MKIPQPTRLFHHTCSHGAAGIERDGLIRPLESLNPAAAEIAGPEASWRVGISWLTDLEILPHAESMGLTMFHLFCDRTEHRFEADPKLALRAAAWWPAWCAEGIRSGRLPASARSLSFAEGAMPAHWWVVRAPIPVLR